MIGCVWVSTEHTCKGIQPLKNASSPVVLYQNATFCLSPTGDSFTRKSLFDSYLSGCIPVIFSRLSLHLYAWHLSQNDIEMTSIFVPRRRVITKKFDIMRYLSKITKEEIISMQKSIERIAFRLQYSVVPRNIREHSGESDSYKRACGMTLRLDRGISSLEPTE